MSSEDGEGHEQVQGGNILMQSAKALGPFENFADDTDQHVANMVNFWFDNVMWYKDYKVICADECQKS